MKQYKIRFIGDEALFENVKSLIEGAKHSAIIEAKKEASARQQRALHKWFDMLADTLNDAGWDMKKTLKQEIDIPWTKTMVKEHIWRPLQEVMLQKRSTTDLNSDDIEIIYKTIVRALASKTGCDIPPFPSINN